MGNCDSKHRKGLSQVSGDDQISKAKKYQLIGNYEKANKLYCSSIENKGPSAEAYTGLGNVASYQLKYEEAIKFYQKAISIDASYKFAFNGMGNSYDEMKMDDKAVTAYQNALKIDPQFAFAHNGLGNFYYYRKNFKNALPHYESALESDPQNPLIHANIACCLIYLKDIERSLQEFDKTKELAGHKEELSEPNRRYLNEKLKQFKDELKKFHGEGRQEIIEKFKRSMQESPLQNDQNVEARIHQLLKA